NCLSPPTRSRALAATKMECQPSRLPLKSTSQSRYSIRPTRLENAALATERVERRLAAILAADVAGYSRLMSADEEGTHERLRAHLAELVHPKIDEHRGRGDKHTGG